MAKRLIVKRVRSRRSAKDFLSPVINQLMQLVSSPVPLLLTVFALYVCITVTQNATDNAIVRIANEFKKHTPTKPLGDWIAGHVNQTAGLFAFLPCAFAIRRHTGVILLAAIFIALYMPTAKPYEYLLQSALLYLFATIRGRSSKVFVVLLAVLCYYSGFGLSNLFGNPPSS
jgi:succinate dehydrogenase hydrophobic anchor subunit